MKRTTLIVLAFAVVFSSMASMVLAGSLSDKEQKLIDSVQTRFERTSNLRDMRPNQLALRFGPPLGFGVEYSYNMNETLAMGVGLGSMGGLNADLGFNWYIINTVIAPVVNAGIAYVGGDVCLFGGAGVDVQLDNAFGIQLGLDITKQIIDAPNTDFKVFNYSDPANVMFLTGGVSYRF